MPLQKTFNLAGLSTSYLIIPDKAKLNAYNSILNDKLHLNMGNIAGSVALQAAYNFGADWLKQLLEYVAKMWNWFVFFAMSIYHKLLLLSLNLHI